MTTLVCMVGIYGAYIKLTEEEHDLGERIMIGISAWVMGMVAFVW